MNPRIQKPLVFVALGAGALGALSLAERSAATNVTTKSSAQHVDLLTGAHRPEHATTLHDKTSQAKANAKTVKPRLAQNGRPANLPQPSDFPPNVGAVIKGAPGNVANSARNPARPPGKSDLPPWGAGPPPKNPKISDVDRGMFADITPVPEGVDDDPLTVVKSASQSGGGKMLYTALIPPPGMAAPWEYFVLRDFGKQGAQVWRIKTPLRAFDPQWSPDGKVVLFKSADFRKLGTYRLQIWDVASGKVTPGPDEPLRQRETQWAPDGKSLAFLRGEPGQPGPLCTYDLTTQKTREVGANLDSRGWAWTKAGTLIYSQLPTDIPKTGPHLPDLYETASGGGKPQLLQREAYSPVPSPNDKYIAFFGSADPEKDQRPRGPFLCLHDRTMKERRVFETVQRGTVRWFPDSSRFVVANFTPRADKSIEARLQIFPIGVEKEEAKPPVTVDLPLQELYAKASGARAFAHLLRVSADGTSLLIEAQATAGGTEWTGLYAMSLRDGTTTLRALWRTAAGHDYLVR